MLQEVRAHRRDFVPQADPGVQQLGCQVVVLLLQPHVGRGQTPVVTLGETTAENDSYV